jgi:hypothetical protein
VSSKKKLFIAIRKDNALRVLGEYSLVIARKIGLPPSGSTIGNSALRIRNRLFAASTKMFLQPRPIPGAPARRFSTDIDREIVASLGKMWNLHWEFAASAWPGCMVHRLPCGVTVLRLTIGTWNELPNISL